MQNDVAILLILIGLRAVVPIQFERWERVPGAVCLLCGLGIAGLQFFSR